MNESDINSQQASIYAIGTVESDNNIQVNNSNGQSQSLDKVHEGTKIRTPPIKNEDPIILPSPKNEKPEEFAQFANLSGPPVHEIVGGSSVRQYLNKHLTKYLLEGLKEINKTKPENPLRILGEFLIKKSEEEGEGEGN